MAVVRREGDWRLEKIEDGVYEITYNERAELKLITADYQPTGFLDARNGFALPVREVDTFSDAEAIFTDHVQHTPSPGLTDIPPITGRITAENARDTDRPDADLADLPPGGVILTGLGGGGYLLSQTGFAPNSPLFLIGTALMAAGVLVTALAYRVYARDWIDAAIDYLLSTEDTDSETDATSDADSLEKTPPAPQSLKDDLYFNRANQRCEWCEERVDSPDVHHITSRADGGPNEPANLIVLCPNCHRKADRDAIPRSRLKQKVERQLNHAD